MKKTLSHTLQFLQKQWSFLALTAASIAVMMGPALAATDDLNAVVNQVGSQAQNLPALLSLGAYTIGTGAIIAGGLKLKAHADNPGNTPISHGLVRLLVGGTLMAVPAVGKQVINTVGTTNQANFMRTNTTWTN